MVQSAAGATGGIFISYRRAETAYPAAWLYRRLAEHYGDGQLFKDIDSIELGDDFAEEIRRAVGSCDVLLALIGSRWLTVTDEHGRRRLDDPQDYVRLEIEAALSRDIRVVPILVDGPRMPTADELPDGLKPLSRRQALELSAARFEYDVSRLLRALDKELAEIRVEREKPEPTTAAPPVTADTPPATRPARTRRPTRAWLLAGAGTAIVLILLISVLLANRGKTIATNEPVFRDDFSSRAAGWEGSGAAAPGAGYADGAYRISAPPDLEGSGTASAPRKAAGVWPTAPPRIQVTVAGQRLPESDNDMGFGILCRVNGDAAYVLTIDDNYAKIEKWGAYQLLKETAAQVDPYSTNDLRAVCTGGAGPEAVHLELWVNGAKVLETTDTNAPLPPGGVGLAVTTHQTTRASIAEFDNFVVEQVAGGQ